MENEVGWREFDEAFSSKRVKRWENNRRFNFDFFFFFWFSSLHNMLFCVESRDRTIFWNDESEGKWEWGLCCCWMLGSNLRDLFKKRWEMCTYNLSVSCGIFLGTVDKPRCEQSTVCPVHVQSLGHFVVNMSPPLLRPFKLRLELKCEPNGSAMTSGTDADINRKAASNVNILLLWIVWFMMTRTSSNKPRASLSIPFEWRFIIRLVFLFFFLFFNPIFYLHDVYHDIINWCTSVRDRLSLRYRQ